MGRQTGKQESNRHARPGDDRILNHVWTIHSLELGFRYTWGISSCPGSYTNLHSFRRHVRDKHLWFFEIYLKVFDKDLPNNLDISQLDKNGFSPVENIVDHEEDFVTDLDFDHIDDHILPNINTLVVIILLELREQFNVTTKATCFIAEKMSQINY